MSLAGGNGLKSAGGAPTAAGVISALVGQAITALKITLTQATGQDAVAFTNAGARLNLATADTRSVLYQIATNFIGTDGGFTTGAAAGGSGIGDLTVKGDAYFGFGASTSIGYVTGKLTLPFADTTGTPGNATANTLTGKSSIAAAASSCVISNTRIGAGSVIMISPLARDATGLLPIVSATSPGTSFTVSTTANCTAALSFAWLVIN